MSLVCSLQGILNNNNTTLLPFFLLHCRTKRYSFPSFPPSPFLSILFFFLSSPFSQDRRRRRRRSPEGSNMRVRQPLQVGWLRQLMVVLAFFLLLVCGEKEAATTVVGVYNRSPNMQEKQQHHERQQRQRLRHSFEVYFASKRKVPNASDPLHNRWSYLAFTYYFCVIIIAWEVFLESWKMWKEDFENHGRTVGHVGLCILSMMRVVR